MNGKSCLHDFYEKCMHNSYIREISKINEQQGLKEYMSIAWFPFSAVMGPPTQTNLYCLQLSFEDSCTDFYKAPKHSMSIQWFFGIKITKIHSSFSYSMKPCNVRLRHGLIPCPVSWECHLSHLQVAADSSIRWSTKVSDPR